MSRLKLLLFNFDVELITIIGKFEVEVKVICCNWCVIRIVIPVV